MKKILSTKLIISVFILLSVLVAGCGKVTPSPNVTNTPTATDGATASPIGSPAGSPVATSDQDVKTTPSMVNTNEAFEKAISNEGTWIICLLTDLSFDKDLVLEGEFTNGKKDAAGNDVIQRKIALYEQDENRKVTARYTLTAPKLTINSPEARIQSGTFKGDLYVSSKNFQLVDTTVEGNVYFTNEEAKSTFKMDEASKVTGKQELKKQ
ncbi:MAG TPA: hypothetical protein GXZ22_07010 [Clostridiaceae bacterium]|jgi:hypothetical protein|nr:hypothetical protein [Clostridiaceae bacterium]